MTNTKMLQILIDGQVALSKGQEAIKKELEKLNKRLITTGKAVACN